MKLKQRIIFLDGIDIYINEVWYGIHFYWQSIPLFGIINSHRKCNTLHEYGFIFFGLWIFIKIDR
jgi:hypothetical protein